MPKPQQTSKTTRPADDTMPDYPDPEIFTESVGAASKKGDPNKSTEMKDPFSTPEEERHASFSLSKYSQPSAVQFDQEPFSTLQKNATKLILDHYPNYSPEDVQIERMQGGGYNCVVGINLCKRPPKFPWYTAQGFKRMIQPCLTGRQKNEIKSEKLVLRIPRHLSKDLPYQVATLSYLRYRLAYPVPLVTVFDSSSQNSLNHTYMLQERLPGQPLNDLWPTLNRAQQLSSIRALSAILLHLRSVKNKCPGLISILNTTYDLKQDLIRTEPVPIPPSNRLKTAAGTPTLSTPQTTKSFLLDLCARHRAHASAMSLPSSTATWARIEKMIRKLHDLGLIPDSDPFCLYHGDLLPRNLLVEPTSPSTVAITGILDWDFALFAPAFMSTRAPFFVWSPGEDEDRDALVEPQDAELREAKRAFESVVGRDFLDSAYRVELVLLRRLWGVLIAGFRSGADVWLAEDVLDQFAQMHPLD